MHQSKLTQENLLELSVALYSASHPSAAVVWRSELPDARCYSSNPVSGRTAAERRVQVVGRWSILQDPVATRSCTTPSEFIQRTSRTYTGSTVVVIVSINQDNMQVGRQALAGVNPEQLESGISYVLLRSSGLLVGHLQSGHPGGEGESYTGKKVNSLYQR